MITVARQYEHESEEFVFTVRVPRADLVSIDLDPTERAQLYTPAQNAVDVLLDLHTLAFRQQQQLNEEPNR